MIKVENLCKGFGSTRAVVDLSFHGGKGEVVGFLGPNGAGKTTTMRLLTHYLMPDSGTVHIAGIDLEEDPLSARKHIGYLPESAPLYNDLTVIEYLKFAASIRRIPSNLRRGRIRDMVMACGLEDVITRNVGVLSKGYRQRVGLAQTMIHDPDILILDEPTTGLDPNQIAEIRSLIQKIGREKTIIISTHILPEVQATCSRVLILNRGCVVADDSVAALAQRTEWDTVYTIKVRGGRDPLEAALGEAPFIKTFDIREEEGLFTVRIQGVLKDGDLGEELFKLAVAGGFILAEIRRETASLEDVFASLTLGEETP